MSFDGFFLHHMTEELRRELLGGRIQKINQPFEQELVLQIRSNRQSHKLLLSAHSVFGRVQLTDTTFENPAVPNTFIMVMRKYLQGAVIEAIQQVENDRILEISVSNKNEIGDSVAVTLVIEIMAISFSWTNLAVRLLKPSNMSDFLRIAIERSCRAQPMSHRLRQAVSILSLWVMKSSLKSYILRI